MLLLDAALFPATVSADSTDSITVDGVTLDTGAPYLANGASTACADRPDSGGYAFYDAATGTLTLHNAVISGAASESGSQHEECTICGFKKACVEILPVGPSAPQTGDNNRVESSLAVMLLALGGIAAAITIGRKKSRMAK